MNKKQIVKNVRDNIKIVNGKKVMEIHITGDCPWCIEESKGEAAAKRFVDENIGFLICPKHYEQIRHEQAENQDKK